MAWLAALVLALAALVAERELSLPVWAGPAAAGALATVLAVGLAARTGGRPWLPGALVALLTVVTAVLRWPVLLAGGAVGTAILAAALAIVGTTPARTFRRVILEVVVATALATAAGLGVAGFHSELHPVRFGYVVLAGALLTALVLVYRLGAGLHGLGRRGYVLAGGALLLLAFALAYSAALGRWGSPELVGQVEDFRNLVRSHLHAVPHPIEALLGVPALAWGVFMRARRRQGWWVCAFGAAATAPATTRFLEFAVPTRATVLAAVYSLVVGLVIGYVLIRIEQSFTGTHGHRARRTEEAGAHRPEPGRMHALS